MDVVSTAKALMDQHGLTALGWIFHFDHAVRRAGRCSYRRKVISVSKHYVRMNVVDNPSEILDTILHEIAHALCKPGTHHGQEWKDMCVRIGAKPQRCCDKIVKMPTGKLTATCGGCSQLFGRHKRVSSNRVVWCAKCGPELGKLTFTCSHPTTTSRSPQVLSTQPIVAPPIEAEEW